MRTAVCGRSTKKKNTCVHDDDVHPKTADKKCYSTHATHALRMWFCTCVCLSEITHTHTHLFGRQHVFWRRGSL